MTALEEWTDQVCGALRLGPVDAPLVLGLARDVAHGVMRPAAPLTTYLLGVAVGRGADPRDAAGLVNGLIAAWPKPADDTGR